MSGTADPPAASADRRAALLTERRAELLAELAALGEEGQATGGISFGKRVGEGTNIAVARLSQVAVHERLTELLAEVDRALAKVAEGSYGRCDRCGQTIAAERLEALPWATRCVRCAGQPRR